VNSNYIIWSITWFRSSIDLLVIAGVLQEIFMYILMCLRYQEFKEMILISARQYQSVI